MPMARNGQNRREDEERIIGHGRRRPGRMAALITCGFGTHGGLEETVEYGRCQQDVW